MITHGATNMSNELVVLTLSRKKEMTNSRCDMIPGNTLPSRELKFFKVVRHESNPAYASICALLQQAWAHPRRDTQIVHQFAFVSFIKTKETLSPLILQDMQARLDKEGKQVSWDTIITCWSAQGRTTHFRPFKFRNDIMKLDDPIFPFANHGVMSGDYVLICLDHCG